MSKPRGRARTAINKASYLLYVNTLETQEKGFPANELGEANISEIARECDFGRDRLYQGSPLYNLFMQDLVRIGLEGSNKKRNSNDFLAKKAEGKSKDASILKTQLDSKVQEIAALREKFEKLESDFEKLKSRKSEHIAAMDELENTGRRSFFSECV